LRRAKQTADIVALALGKPQLVKPQEILRPQMTPEPFLEALQQSPAASVLAIGHQPDLGELVSFLQWGLHAAQMHLSEATVVGFELPSPASRDRARLELLLPPDAAEKIVR
jgi:phosphohistidine phosphatase SixA